jgi:hypothetical protein
MIVSILTAVLLMAPVVEETGRFSIRQNGRTIGTEEFSIRARDKGYSVEGRTKLEGDPNLLVSRMELDENLLPTSYEYSHGTGTIRVRIDSKSSELTVLENGDGDSTDFRFPRGASIVDNNFFHHYLILLYRLKGSGDQSFPIFVPQDMQTGQAKVHASANRTYALDVGDVKLEATVDAQGRLVRLAIPAANVVVER